MRKSLLNGLLAAILVFPSVLFAQRTFSDAKIQYKIEIPPEQLQMDAMFANSTLTQYIRGELSRIDINFNVISYVYLLSSKNQTMVTLLDLHGDKYIIRADKAAYEKETKNYEAIQYTDQKEVKEILGYKCRRAIGKMPDGTTFDVYYTTDLVPENKLYNRRFMNLAGVPLEFEIIVSANSKMKVTASKVDLSPVPASVFDVPRGYKEMTAEELKKIRG